MTDRVHSLVVVIENDTRVDCVQPLIDAISQLRGVVSVKGEIADFDSHMAEQRARRELREKLWKVLNDEDE
jgi:deferrochelatase/peroxidase EfeB